MFAHLSYWGSRDMESYDSRHAKKFARLHQSKKKRKLGVVAHMSHPSYPGSIIEGS
jgi:hypothetical protein